MFTGLVHHIATVESVTRNSDGITLDCATEFGAISAGESIALNGCCLTALENNNSGRARFFVSQESLRTTALGSLTAGSRMNVERALRTGDPAGGHFVSGHVDGVGRVCAVEDDGASRRIWFSYPAMNKSQVCERGSITVDGVSLTIISLDDNPRQPRFAVNVIPHTLDCTTLGSLEMEDSAHLEFDMLAKMVARHAAVSGVTNDEFVRGKE